MKFLGRGKVPTEMPLSASPTLYPDLPHAIWTGATRSLSSVFPQTYNSPSPVPHPGRPEVTCHHPYTSSPESLGQELGPQGISLADTVTGVRTQARETWNPQLIMNPGGSVPSSCGSQGDPNPSFWHPSPTSRSNSLCMWTSKFSLPLCLALFNSRNAPTLMSKFLRKH